MEPTLLKYFETKSKTLSSLFDVSKEQNASNNLGKNRENFVKSFLSTVLPPRLKNIYDGEIIDKNNNKTGQLDLVICRDDAPCLDFGGSNTYLVEGVFAVIEIKSFLDKEKILEVKKSFEKVSKLNIDQFSGVVMGNHLNRPLRILFAYDGSNLETIFKNLKDENCIDLFDLVCILNKGAIISKGRILHIFDKQNNNQKIEHDFILKGEASALGFLYFYLVQYGSSFSTISLNLESYFQPLEKWGIIGTDINFNKL